MISGIPMGTIMEDKEFHFSIRLITNCTPSYKLCYYRFNVIIHLFFVVGKKEAS